MQQRYSDLEEISLRFCPEIYLLAKQKKLNPLPLLACIEDCRNIATGVHAVLTLLNNNEMTAPDEGALSEHMVSQLLVLCRTSLDLLNDKIEHTADHFGQVANSDLAD